MFHNILVVIDGSTDTELALTHAITLAEYSHSRLTLFTAVEQPPPAASWGLAAPGMIGFVERTEARANKIASRARDRIPNDVPIAAVVTSRPVKPALVRQITDGHHDLAVLGHRGHDARWSAMPRSVSDYVLRPTAVPVAIIRAESSRRDESPDFDPADYAPVPRQPTSRVESKHRWAARRTRELRLAVTAEQASGWR